MNKTIQEKFKGLRFKANIKNSNVYDVNNVRLGRLLDVIFKKSNDGMIISKFTIGGSRWEELLEDLKIKPDVDPVFPVDVISSITSDSITLKCSKDKLKSTSLDDDAIEEDEIKLSDMVSIKLIDVNNEELGHIIDIKFTSKAFNFVVGDGKIKHLLDSLGLRNDIDFLVSSKYITDISNKTVKLSESKTKLDIIFKADMKAEFREKTEEQLNYEYSIYYPMK